MATKKIITRRNPPKVKLALKKRRIFTRNYSSWLSTARIVIFVTIFAIVGGTALYLTRATSEPALDAYIDAPFADPHISEPPSVIAFDTSARTAAVSQDTASENADFININKLRDNKGKSPYVRSACLTGIARAYAKAYATYKLRFQNTDLRNQIKTNCSQNVDAVAANMMAQDTEGH